MKTVVNLKVDRDIKIKAQSLAKDFGLSLSAVLNVYLRQFVRDKALTFSTAPQMTPELENLLGKVEPDIKAKRNLSKPIINEADLDSFFTSL
ncbi:MAG TPA: hypothetical protein DEB09_05335 [Candidatus Magasanikbacteria bacterium]|nr:hypothetical protein [Candidatus Magasanikbacteria bacterium]